MGRRHDCEERVCGILFARFERVDAGNGTVDDDTRNAVTL